MGGWGAGGRRGGKRGRKGRDDGEKGKSAAGTMLELKEGMSEPTPW